jgi:hypothetical protein
MRRPKAIEFVLPFREISIHGNACRSHYELRGVKTFRSGFS